MSWKLNWKLPWRVIGRWALSAACFAASFIGACLGIGRAIPFPEVPEVHAKLEHLRRHAAEYDTIFFGSSRIYHHILPSMFDRIAAAHGVNTHSFNAGIDGMRPPELNYYCDQVLKIRPRWRFAFFEAGVMQLALDKDKVGTIRSDYWHDWKRMRWLWAGVMEMRKKHRSLKKTLESLQEPLSDFALHLGPFARTLTNMGRASFFMDSALGSVNLDAPDEAARGQAAARRWALGAGTDGFTLSGRGEKISPADLADLLESMADRRKRPAIANYGDPVSQAAFEEMLRGFERNGARTALIIPPSPGYRKFHLRSEKTSGRVVFDYSDLDRYAPLYEVPNRLDKEHLNTAGAKVFTKIFAEEFCTAAQGISPKPNGSMGL